MTALACSLAILAAFLPATARTLARGLLGPLARAVRPGARQGHGHRRRDGPWACVLGGGAGVPVLVTIVVRLKEAR